MSGLEAGRGSGFNVKSLAPSTWPHFAVLVERQFVRGRQLGKHHRVVSKLVPAARND